MPSAPAIAFDCRPSRWLLAAVAIAAALALLGVWLSAAGLIAGCLCSVTLVGYTAVEWRRLRRDQPRRAVWQSEGHWRIRDASGAEHVADLHAASVRGGCIALSLRREDGRRVPLILLPDNADADLRRRLRVRLRRAWWLQSKPAPDAVSKTDA